jgi:hypothetical protein
MRANWKYSDLLFIIEEAMKNLERSDRFRTFGCPPRLAIAHTFCAPDENAMDLSDRGILCGSEQIAAEYKEEISQIEHLMYVHKIPVQTKRKSNTEVRQMFDDALNRRAFAMNLWEVYGIPWRFKGEKTYIIHPPRDLNGSPVIQEMTTFDFISTQLDRLSDAEGELAKFKKRWSFWETAFFLLIIVIGFYVLLNINHAIH